ncbi:MAG: hypothetical protein K2M89_06650 [Clostridiales bacterium]|nr:hypothetical protein [Clostridiales bacterium]
MFWRKKAKNDNTAAIKEKLVNLAFDTFLKENEHYTVAGRVDGAVLVKKIARWAYCDVTGENVNACFSIETDKGLYCFQASGQKLMQIDPGVCTSFYPDLKP